MDGDDLFCQALLVNVCLSASPIARSHASVMTQPEQKLNALMGQQKKYITDQMQHLASLLIYCIGFSDVEYLFALSVMKSCEPRRLQNIKIMVFTKMIVTCIFVTVLENRIMLQTVIFLHPSFLSLTSYFHIFKNNAILRLLMIWYTQLPLYRGM